MKDKRPVLVEMHVRTLSAQEREDRAKNDHMLNLASRGLDGDAAAWEEFASIVEADEAKKAKAKADRKEAKCAARANRAARRATLQKS